MKTQVFLPLATFPDANTDAVTVNAVAIAAQLHADLHALALHARIPPVSSPLSRILLDLPARIREAETLSLQAGGRLLAKVVDEGARQDVAVTTASEAVLLAAQGDVATEQARYFDICVVGWETDNQTSRMIAEAVIFGSGKPTVLLPDSASAARIEHVSIAWDGSRVAARAVADALPFLAHASRIHVLAIVDEKPLMAVDGAERLAALLRKRGLNADALDIKAEDCPIAVTLQERAIELGADLLVMGGYGHSRVRDFVLGGATEGVLSDLRLPILMSH
ncbi:universal stress protein [Aminobacter carboxidus]|uniref:Universal stress protein n=1 Tax=Aminobacter carboxidus TaxID=376165 RepID=A0ABR9GGM1_9HYPH|nr:universal stress protein [Aminobacter carboxidus]MBE1202793.1 universal stress protein [Aminobacter carboxidus]